MKTSTYTVIKEWQPLPGVTQFSPIGKTLAQEIADYHYDNVMALHPCHAGDWAVECPSGIAANIGTVEGSPAILHRFDGNRQLQLLRIA